MVIVVLNKKQIITEDSRLHYGMRIQVWITDDLVHWFFTDDEPFFS
jgi:hypothetical protein